jgi:hypothetical protein
MICFLKKNPMIPRHYGFFKMPICPLHFVRLPETILKNYACFYLGKENPLEKE